MPDPIKPTDLPYAAIDAAMVAFQGDYSTRDAIAAFLNTLTPKQAFDIFERLMYDDLIPQGSAYALILRRKLEPLLSPETDPPDNLAGLVCHVARRVKSLQRANGDLRAALEDARRAEREHLTEHAPVTVTIAVGGRNEQVTL